MGSELSDRPFYRVHASVAVLNASGQLLLVQEEKEVHHGRWNLPGGHVSHGESLAPAAERELFEETCLQLPMQDLLGIYPFVESIRFVFTARANGELPAPGDEILAVKWIELNELLATDASQLVAPENLKTVARDLQQGITYPLSVVHATPRQGS